MNKERSHLAHGGDDILGKAAAALEHIAGATTLAILNSEHVKQVPLYRILWNIFGTGEIRGFYYFQNSSFYKA